MELYYKCIEFFNKQKINIDIKTYQDAIRYIIKNENDKEKVLQAKLSLMKNDLLNAYKVKISNKFIQKTQVPKIFNKSELDLFIPFDITYITFDDKLLKDRYILIQKFYDKINNTDAFNISIMNFITEPVPIIDFLFTYSKNSRIYISCKEITHCKHANISNITYNSDYKGDFIPHGCMKTYRTKDLCETMKLESVYMVLRILKLAFDEFKRNLIIKHLSKPLENKISENKMHNTKGNNENYVYIRPNKIEYINYNTHKSIKGSEKSQHIRREHSRNLKNGKVIKVKQCIVKANAKKTNYKI